MEAAARLSVDKSRWKPPPCARAVAKASLNCAAWEGGLPSPCSPAPDSAAVWDQVQHTRPLLTGAGMMQAAQVARGREPRQRRVRVLREGVLQSPSCPGQGFGSGKPQGQFQPQWLPHEESPSPSLGTASISSVQAIFLLPFLQASQGLQGDELTEVACTGSTNHLTSPPRVCKGAPREGKQRQTAFPWSP